MSDNAIHPPFGPRWPATVSGGDWRKTLPDPKVESVGRKYDFAYE